MRLAAGGAALDHELAGLRRFPERRGFRIGHRGIEFLRFGHHARSRMQVEAAWRPPRSAPVPWATARSELVHCTFGWASPRYSRNASMIFVISPRLKGRL